MLPDAVSTVLHRKSSDRPVLSIGPDASVYEAIAMMAEIQYLQQYINGQYQR